MDIQLIYSSVAVREFSDEELDRLLDTCASFNASKNISGMLLYCNGKFIQALEGEADVVDGLLHKIIADIKHTKVNVLVRTPIKKRDFGGWAMGFRRLDSRLLGDSGKFVPFFEIDFDQDGICEHPNLAIAVLKSFGSSL